MANEAVLSIEKEIPMNMSCADGTGIEKGALLKLTDNNTAIINSTCNDPVAGIAAGEKIASDGITSVAVYRKGTFRVQASGSITVGDSLVLGDTANDVASASVNHENIIGTALETATDNNTFLMELNPTVMKLS